MSKTELKKLVRLAQIVDKFLASHDGIDYNDFVYYSQNPLSEIMDMICSSDYEFIVETLERYITEDDSYPLMILINIDMWRLKNNISG